jgi:hypothetical protein
MGAGTRIFESLTRRTNPLAFSMGDAAPERDALAKRAAGRGLGLADAEGLEVDAAPVEP